MPFLQVLVFTFNVPQTELYYIVLLIVAISHPVSLLVLWFSSNLQVRALYAASAAWMGTSVYILIMFAIYLIVEYFVNIPAQTAGTLILLFAFIVSAYEYSTSLD